MSLRIHFHSPEFPESVVKSLRRRLKHMGHAVPLGRMREATALMYGYGKWNELLGRVGQSTPFLSDQEVGPTVAAERSAVFAERLAQALDLPVHVAAEVVAATGPTSRRSMGVVPFDWDGAVLRMAGAISASARSIEATSIGKFDGFRVAVAGPHSDWAILVDEAGAAIYCKAHGERPLSLRDRMSFGGLFGRRLQDAGLSTAGEVRDPDPVVLRTLRRLDGRALGLLRTVPSFGEEVYRVARLVPEGSAFEDLVARLPMLGAEISHLAHDLHSDDNQSRSKKQAAPREAMIASADPMRNYLDIVGDFARKAWPHHKFDLQRARETVEAIGSVVVLEDLGLLPWHVAFLSFAPITKLPTTPAQLAAAMRFTEKWTTLFKPQIGIDPHDFYREFDGDWALLRSTVAGMKGASFFHNLNEVAQTVTDALLGPRAASVQDYDVLPGRIALEILNRRLTPRLVAGRGMMDLFRPYDRWIAVHSNRGDEGREAYSDQAFLALSSSELLPADLRSLTPRELLLSLCIDPDAYLEALFDPSEFSEVEVEIRITTESARAAVAASLKPLRGRKGDLAGTTTFHHAVIGGITFEAMLSADGPYIRAILGGEELGGVALGCCTSIATFAADPREMDDDDRAAGTYVVKHSSERRIALDGLADPDFERLEDEFGIGERRSGGSDFYQSQAARSLVVYVRSHPRIAKRFADTTCYLGDWYGWAKENAPGAGPSPGRR